MTSNEIRLETFPYWRGAHISSVILRGLRGPYCQALDELNPLLAPLLGSDGTASVEALSTFPPCEYISYAPKRGFVLWLRPVIKGPSFSAPPFSKRDEYELVLTPPPPDRTCLSVGGRVEGRAG